MNASVSPTAALSTTAPNPLLKLDEHDRCWVCGASRSDGLQLKFRAEPDGTVQAEFDCPERYAGYAGVLHGGMVATLLDAAMTHCLFARREIAMTADLRVRFRASVQVSKPATIRAWQVRARGAMEELCAELWQEGELRVAARGKFIRSSQPERGLPRRSSSGSAQSDSFTQESFGSTG
jgi:acyl-coenzyme A thioesterase PaaI-like protein